MEMGDQEHKVYSNVHSNATSHRKWDSRTYVMLLVWCGVRMNVAFLVTFPNKTLVASFLKLVRQSTQEESWNFFLFTIIEVSMLLETQYYRRGPQRVPWILRLGYCPEIKCELWVCIGTGLCLSKLRLIRIATGGPESRST